MSVGGKVKQLADFVGGIVCIGGGLIDRKSKRLSVAGNITGFQTFGVVFH